MPKTEWRTVTEQDVTASSAILSGASGGGVTDFDSQADIWIGTKDSDDIAEGSTHLYLTPAQQAALHDAVTVSDTATIDLTLSGQALTADVIPGGVDHDHLLNFAADEHVAHSGVTLTAGGGLTGGGTIAANRTFAVGEGDGITVAADEISVDVTDIIDTAYGLTESSNNIRLNIDFGLKLDGGAVEVDQAMVPTWTGTHKFTAAGQPTNDIGTDWGNYNHKWRTIYAAELAVQTLVAQDVMATTGGQITVSPTTTLIADCDSADTTIDVEHNNLASGDYVVLKAAPGGVAQFEAMRITSSATTITGGYRYSVSRNEDGTGANDWYAGDAVMELGAGYIDLTATSTLLSDYGPTIAIYDRTGATNWDDLDPVVAVGNLQSFVDYSSEAYGFAAGNDLDLTPSTGFKGVTVDATNGARLYNTNIELYSGTTKTVDIASDGTAWFDNDFEVGDYSGGVGMFYDKSAGTLSLTGGIYSGNGASFHATDVLLHVPFSYAGGYRANTNGGGGQQATESGAVIGVPDGPFGNGAVQVMEGATNYFMKPTFYSLLSLWGSSGTQSLTEGIYHNSCRLTVTDLSGTVGGVQYTSSDFPVTAGDSLYLTFRARASVSGRTINYIHLMNSAGNQRLSNVAITNDWQEYSVPITVSSTGNAGLLLAVDTRYNGWQIGDWGEFDEVQLTKTPYQLPFFFGDMPGCSWSGAARASTSVASDGAIAYDSKALNATNGTIAMWLNPYLVDTTQRYYVYHSSGSDYILIGSYTDASSFRVHVGATAQTYGTIAVGEWQHVSLTWADGEAAFYVDGELAGSWSYTGGSVGTNPIYIVNTSTAQVSDFFTASRAYTADEIKQIYLSNAPVVVSRGNHELFVAGDDGYVSVNENGIFAEANGAPSFALSNADDITWSTPTSELDAGDMQLGKYSDGGWLNFDRSAAKLSLGYDSSEIVALNGDGATITGDLTVDGGSIIAGGGNVVIDGDGVSLLPDTSYTVASSLSWGTAGSICTTDGGIIPTMMAFRINGNVIMDICSDLVTPQVRFFTDVGFNDYISLTEISSTPTYSTNNANCYVKNDKFIMQWRDGSTTRYKYLSLSGTGTTWTHTTTAP